MALSRSALRHAWSNPRSLLSAASALLAALLVLLPGVLVASAPASDAFDATPLRAHLRDFELRAMDPGAFRDRLATGSLDLTLLGHALRLLVEPAPWASSYKLGEIRGDGSVAYTEPAFRAVVYQGRVQGEAGSQALFVVTGSGVAGSVTVDDDTILFEPARFSVPGAPPGISVVFRAEDDLQAPVRADAPPVEPHGPQALSAPSVPATAPPSGAPDPLGPLLGGSASPMSYAPGPDRKITLWYDTQMEGVSGYADKIWSIYNEVESQWPAMVGWNLTVVNNAIYKCPSTQCVGGEDRTRLAQFGNAVDAEGQPWSGYELAHLLTTDLPKGLGDAYQPGRYEETDAGSTVLSHDAALIFAHEVGHSFNARHVRGERYTHMHGTLATTHSTLMLGLNAYPAPYFEEYFEFSSANTNWIRACNLLSWTSGTKAPGSVAGFGDRCYTGVATLDNGGHPGTGYDGANHAGKLFTNVQEGTLQSVCAWMESAGTQAVVAFKAQPDASPPLFTTTITAQAPGMNCSNPDKDWTASTLFMYKLSGDARIAFDPYTPYDGRVSLDGGATWQADNVRRGYAIDILKDAFPVDSCGAMAPGASLGVDGTLQSCDGRLTLAHQGDGNVVLYQGTQPLWATSTSGATTSFVMQGDGNLVLYNGATVKWASNTNGHPGAWLSLRNDGRLMLYSKNGTTLWYGGCGLLPPEANLLRGQSFKSCDGRFTLAHQGDGNVVLYQGTQPLWATNTAGQATTTLAMQGDGNLVLYNGPNPLWASGTAGNPGAWLKVQDDGSAHIYTRYRTSIWTT